MSGMQEADAATLEAVAGVVGQIASTAGGDLQALDPDTVKSCCASVYGIDLVALFLGESYHPGGADLSLRLADVLDLQAGERVLDVASGIGTTALLLAAERSVEVVGVDLGETQVARAQARSAEAGLDRQVTFELGDAERLPFEDGSFDAVVCECAFCTFPDKATAAAELARVVKPGGRVGITDVWLDPAQLDPELQNLAARVACLADARPIDEVQDILAQAGLTTTRTEHHDDALAATIDQVTNRLRALRLMDIPVLQSFDLRRGVELARKAQTTVTQGKAGYMVLAAAKGKVSGISEREGKF